MAAERVVKWASIEEAFAGDGKTAAGGALLLGNGFSSNIWSEFQYGSLLERSELQGTARALFRGRFNFETVLAELATSRQVLCVAAPEHEILSQLKALGNEVRMALLDTVSQVHPNADQLLAPRTGGAGSRITGMPVPVLGRLAGYLPRYSRVFVTNYDLIAYWAKAQAGMADLFPSSDPFDEDQADSWMRRDSRPKIFFVHGALHLWRSLKTNAEGKHTADTETFLLDVIRESVNHADRVPLFISEGSSEDKVARISASPYLSYCMRTLDETDGPLTVLGQSLLDVDEHIRKAIQRHPGRNVAIGVYVGDVAQSSRKEELVTRAKEIQGRVSKCNKVVFFDSAEHPLTDPSLRCQKAHSLRSS